MTLTLVECRDAFDTLQAYGLSSESAIKSDERVSCPAGHIDICPPPLLWPGRSQLPMERTTEVILSKVPEVTLSFWIIKIIATTLGETGGDAVTMSMNLGYFVGTLIFALIFIAAVGSQLLAKRFHPFLYWFVIVATTTAGTALADFLDRSLGIGYTGGTTILIMLVLSSLGIWYRTLGSVAVMTVTEPKAEAFYWATIMFSQTLGTALGDWMADSTGLGYEGSALVFGTALAVVAALYGGTKVSRTLLFWVAFILTRPLGATLGDLLDKPINHGGLALSRYTASALLAASMVACILLLPERAGKAH